FFIFTALSIVLYYSLSLHDALPISVLIEFSTSALNARSNSLLISFTIFRPCASELFTVHVCEADVAVLFLTIDLIRTLTAFKRRSEEHTSELQSRFDLVCRLLLVKK